MTDLALFASSFLLGSWLGFLWGQHRVHKDPSHIDRLARKDRRIKELEQSLEHVKAQRFALAEQVRQYRDERGRASL